MSRSKKVQTVRDGVIVFRDQTPEEVKAAKARKRLRRFEDAQFEMERISSFYSDGYAGEDVTDLMDAGNIKLGRYRERSGLLRYAKKGVHLVRDARGRVEEVPYEKDDFVVENGFYTFEITPSEIQVVDEKLLHQEFVKVLAEKFSDVAKHGPFPARFKYLRPTGGHWVAFTTIIEKDGAAVNISTTAYDSLGHDAYNVSGDEYLTKSLATELNKKLTGAQIKTEILFAPNPFEGKVQYGGSACASYSLRMLDNVVAGKNCYEELTPSVKKSAAKIDLELREEDARVMQKYLPEKYKAFRDKSAVGVIEAELGQAEYNPKEELSPAKLRQQRVADAASALVSFTKKIRDYQESYRKFNANPAAVLRKEKEERERLQKQKEAENKSGLFGYLWGKVSAVGFGFEH
jgi:hypothetical protein